MAQFGTYTTLAAEDPASRSWMAWTPTLPFFTRLSPLLEGMENHLCASSLKARIDRLRAITPPSPHIGAPIEYCPGHDDDDRHGWTVSRHTPGLTLRQHTQQRRLEVQDAISVVYQACLGLRHTHQRAHEDGLHHGLSMNTLRVGGAGVTRVDAWDMPMPSDITTAGMMVGAATAMSPEHFMGSSVDSRSAVYQLGLILYELLTGRHPLSPNDGPPSFSELLKAFNGDHTIVAPRQHGASISAALEVTLVACLARDPAARPAEPGVLGDTLAEICGCRPPPILAMDLNDALVWTRQRIYAPHPRPALMDLLFARPDLQAEGTVPQYIGDHIGDELVADLDGQRASPLDLQLLSRLPACRARIERLTPSPQTTALTAIMDRQREP